MTLHKIPICFNCKHFDKEKVQCPAFPQRDIPDEIIFGSDDHSKVHPEQTGDYTYKPIKEE